MVARRALLSASILVVFVCSAAVAQSPCPFPLDAFAPCGGMGSGCIGSQCVDNPWQQRCCPAGQQCNRKTQWHWKCEDAPLNCPPYAGAACAKIVPVYGTCGGLGSGCTGCQCRNGVWPGFCCAPGSICNKKTDFYYKCEPGPNTPVQGAPSSLDPVNNPALPKPNKPTNAPNVAPKTPAPLPTGTHCNGVPIALHSPCGGKGSGCTGSLCRDGPWANKCCPGICVRKTEWYWKCEDKPLVCPPHTNKNPCGIKVLDEFAPCGGLGSGCTGCMCQDKPWDGYCCPIGFTCSRKTQFHWKCDKL